jgi:hypothetical protein
MVLCEHNKRRRISGDGSRSTSTGSVVTAFSGATDTFDGCSQTAYKQWLAAVQPTAAKHKYASFVTKKVADQADGVWTTGTIQCLHQGILPSMTRTLPADTILPNKVSLSRLCGQITLIRPVTFFPC